MSTVTRKIKNVVKQYTFAEIKVREATSNDPWGPTVKQIDEVAELSYNNVALVEILGIIWKRLSERGKNWRHVFKSLIVLDHLIKCGSEKVVQHTLERMELLTTLSTYDFYEEGRDIGVMMRDKSKQITTLLSDQDRLKNERTKMSNSKRVFAQNTASGKGIGSPSWYSGTENGKKFVNPEEKSIGSPVSPVSDPSDEDVQLQLALAMSKEEHDEEEKRRRMEELRLQMALEESRRFHGSSGNDDRGTGASSEDPEVNPHRPLGQRLTLLSIATEHASKQNPPIGDQEEMDSDLFWNNPEIGEPKAMGELRDKDLYDPWQDLASVFASDTTTTTTTTNSGAFEDPWKNTSINNFPEFPVSSIDSSAQENPNAWSNFSTDAFATQTTGLNNKTMLAKSATTTIATLPAFNPSQPAFPATMFSPTNPFFNTSMTASHSTGTVGDPWNLPTAPSDPPCVMVSSSTSAPQHSTMFHNFSLTEPSSFDFSMPLQNGAVSDWTNLPAPNYQNSAQLSNNNDKILHLYGANLSHNQQQQQQQYNPFL